MNTITKLRIELTVILAVAMLSIWTGTVQYMALPIIIAAGVVTLLHRRNYGQR